ncbi:MAG TPA: hypothetical protein PLJ35_06505 [Anaerolineae bacterium]|nr:hypothetical protein [Anaerolineae bacterium]HOQ98458.1 hypothetical protein [Anaerolineae bacterium]HPL26741.1 hypothetical protein [Anaerolineae bacterium]
MRSDGGSRRGGLELEEHGDSLVEAAPEGRLVAQDGCHGGDGERGRVGIRTGCSGDDGGGLGTGGAAQAEIGLGQRADERLLEGRGGGELGAQAGDELGEGGAVLIGCEQGRGELAGAQAVH